MLEIMGGNFEAVKAEMKQFSDKKKDEIRALKKRLKEAKKDRQLASQGIDWDVRVQNQIEELEEDQRYYSPSRVLPVKVGSIVINFKVYEKYLKVLKGEQLKEEIGDVFNVSHKTGYIEFIDLSDKFEGFEHIPEAELKDEES